MHKTIYKNGLPAQTGFTLIEILVVMGMIAIIASLGLFMSIGSFQGSNFRNERSNILSALYKARNQAMNNVCFGTCSGGAPHGVHFETSKFTIFQGVDWTSRTASVDEITEISPNIITTGLTDVVFAQLSGNTSVTPIGVWDLTVTDTSTNQTSTITFNPEGQITWTN